MSDPPDHKIDWRSLLRRSFGLTFWLFALLAVSMAVACYVVLGAESFAEAVQHDGDMLLDLTPRVIAAQIAAGFVWILVPRDRMSAFLHRHSGNKGLVLGTVAGIITPGGPASAFPFLAILAGAGAERGILVAYITSWALLGMQRMIVWDVAFMGLEFSVLRFLVSLPLPIVAGLIARRLRYTVSVEAGVPPRDAAL